MEGEFVEQFKCPICFEIPEKEIYQCQNGHTICDICIQNLTLCPQCRVNLRSIKIRNRALEEILDLMTFDCSFKSEGCKSKVSRKEISSHYETCSFGRFGGELVPLCKYLGYKCGHKISTTNLDTSLKHFKQEHSCITVYDNALHIKVQNIKDIDRNKRCLWKPILLNLNTSHYLLVIFSTGANILFTVISLGNQADDNDQMQIKFTMTSKLDKIPTLEWTIKPIPQRDSEEVLKFPPFKIPLNLLKNYLDRESLTVKVQLSSLNFTDVDFNKVMIELDSFSTLQLPNQSIIQHSSLLRSSFQFSDVSQQEMALALHQYFDQPLSQGHWCNACSVQPIVGVLYKCLQCKDFDLCSGCMANNEHSFHHFTALCTREQVTAVQSRLRVGKKWHSFVDHYTSMPLNHSGYDVGSIQSDAMELHCQKCSIQPDYICLQCPGPYGLCKMCFLIEMGNHDKHHNFAVTMSDSARQFALYVLRRHKVLPLLKHEQLRS